MSPAAVCLCLAAEPTPLRSVVRHPPRSNRRRFLCLSLFLSVSRLALQGGYSDMGGAGEYGANGDYGGGDFTGGFDQQAANGDVQQQQQANGNGGGFDNGMGFQQDNMVCVWGGGARQFLSQTAGGGRSQRCML